MSKRSPAVILYDASGVPLAVADGVAIPVGTPALLIAGKDGSNSRFAKVDASGRLEENIGAWFGSTAPTVGQKTKANSLPITIASDQGPFDVIVSSVPTTLPNLVNPSFSASDGAVIANAFKRVLTYTVPAGFAGYLIRFASYQTEAAQSRLVAETNLGSHNCNTNVFTAGASYPSPAWASIVEAEVTTAFAAGSGNVVITVTYTNEIGTAARTGTFTIPKGSAVGSRWKLTLQAGDLGVRSIQAMSASPTQVGIVKVLGLVQLAFHDDQNTTVQITSYFTQQAIAFPTGTVLGFEYAGGTVSKTRRFDAVIQLVS